ncbi:MAG: multiprotein-bridging factor 1 family protein [Saprospiraceae bacterium]
MENKSKKARSYSSPLLKKILENRNELETNRTRNRMLLAARIDDLLKTKGWKKKELAAKLDKKPSVITKWLSGTHNFTLDTLSDLESVFGEKIILEKPKQKKNVVYQTIFMVAKNHATSQVSEALIPYGKIENKLQLKTNYQA